MANIFRLIFAVCVSALSAVSHAVITPSYTYQYNTGFVGTPSEIVAHQQAFQSTTTCNYGAHTVPYVISFDNATASSVDIRYSFVCPTGNSATNVLIYRAPRQSSACPVGSVQSGSSCICSEGYKENGFGDGCVKINHDREDCFNFSVSGRMPGGDLVIDYRYTGNVADGSKFCVGVEGMRNPGRGCVVTFNRTASLDYGGGKIISEGNLSMSPDSNMVDQSCALNPSPPDPTKKPEPPEEKCKNGYSGQVNGVTVCVNKVPDSGVGDETKETQSDDGTDTKRVKTEKNTTCTNGVCTTVTTVTTTTTNNASGVSNTTTQTSTTTEGKGTFCEENPSFKLCKDGEEDGSSFGGSCGAGFTCEGDVIQCAIAQEQHRRACKLFDDSNEESQLYQTNKGKEGNQTTNLPGNETVNIAGRIDSSDALGASAAGVADLNVTVLRQSLTLPFSMLNPYLSQLGNVLLAVSFLLALRIVSRG